MLPLNQLREIGVITRLHGIKGNIVVQTLNEKDTELLEEAELVFVCKNGLLIPFFIETVSVKSRQSVILCFRNVAVPEYTRRFLQSKVFVPKSEINPHSTGETSFPDIIGYTVHDKTEGELGFIEKMELIPGNPIIHVKNKKKSILIPWADEIVLNVDYKAKQVVTNIPKGLIDLFM